MNKLAKVAITIGLILISAIALIMIVSVSSVLFNKSAYETLNALGSPHAIRDNWVLMIAAIGIIISALAGLLKMYGDGGASHD